ncbi:SMI1/KNR4 family protein [Myroides sp. TSA_177.3]|uniref:SMI1/KNR4 family protein n=1 Tax=Myroides sp. TSA_177.3 TaxID=3415650 RepID=UPI0040468820
MPFPIELTYIKQTEDELGVWFPDDFKAKMMQENGGELSTEEDDWQLYPFFDRSDKKRISRTCNHIGLETKQAQAWRNFPANAIAIASNGSGDHLILLPEAGNEKQLSEVIYAWWHEEGIPKKVADSIEDLVNE